jgi:hypothetical protein
MGPGQCDVTSQGAACNGMWTYQNVYAVGTQAANQNRPDEAHNEARLEEGIGHGENACTQTALQ